MQKLLSIFVYLILLIFLESAAEVTGVPASAPAELPEEPNYVALTFDAAVLLDGKDLADCSGPERARKMALMVPHTRRTELTTCFEMASAGRYPYTGRLGVLSAEDKRQVHAALALVGAEALAGRDFNRISDGQRHLLLSRGAAGGERGSGAADAGGRASGRDPHLEPYPPGRYGPSSTAPGHSGSAKRSLQTPGHG